MNKKVRCWSKATQQTEFVGKLKNTDGTQPIFILIIAAKIEETRLKFFQEGVTAL